MRMLVGFILVFALTVGSTIGRADEGESIDRILRIESPEASKRVAFRATLVLVGEGGNIEQIEAMTPFERKLGSKQFLLVAEPADERGRIHCQVSRVTDQGERLDGSATGAIVIVDGQLVRNRGMLFMGVPRASLSEDEE